MSKTAQEREETKAQLTKIVAQVNKALKGEGRVYLGNEHPPIRRMSSGVLALDVVTGGGPAYAQLMELFGPESSGKTLLANLLVAKVQRLGGTAVWVKGENFDEQWAKLNGVNTEDLYLIEGATGDTMLETAMTLLESGHVGIIVFDSVQSLGTQREFRGGIESEAYAGAGAPQMWGRIMRRAYSAANRGVLNDTILVSLSQVRMPIGRYNYHETGEPSQILALRHWKGISVRCRRGKPDWIKVGDKKFLASREFDLRCEKNKTAATEGLAASFTYTFRTPSKRVYKVDDTKTAVDMGKALNLIESKGAWLYGYDLKAQGEENFVELLKENPKVMEALYKGILKGMTAD